MKKCFKCGETKPLSEFYKHSAMGDGHLNKCKECTKNDVNMHRLNNIEYIREYDRKRSSQQKRVELRKKVTKTWINDGRHAESQKRYKEKYPEKYRARNIFYAAKRDGKIIKPEACSVCGLETKRLEAHHSDYSKPLDVQWLCISCHAETRRKYPKEIKENTAIYQVYNSSYCQLSLF